LLLNGFVTNDGVTAAIENKFTINSVMVARSGLRVLSIVDNCFDGTDEFIPFPGLPDKMPQIGIFLGAFHRFFIRVARKQNEPTTG
jgi:hypothetical protein